MREVCFGPSPRRPGGRMVSVLVVTMENVVRAVGECTQIRCGVVVARLHELVIMVSQEAL